MPNSKEVCLDQHCLWDVGSDETSLPSYVSSCSPWRPFLGLGGTRANLKRTATTWRGLRRGTGWPGTGTAAFECDSRGLPIREVSASMVKGYSGAKGSLVSEVNAAVEEVREDKPGMALL